MSLGAIDHPEFRQPDLHSIVQSGLDAAHEVIVAEKGDAERFLRYRTDPGAYAREVLGIEWWTR